MFVTNAIELWIKNLQYWKQNVNGENFIINLSQEFYFKIYKKNLIHAGLWPAQSQSVWDLAGAPPKGGGGD